MSNKPFCNKTIVNFGDSIFGNFRAPEDISTYLAEETGAVTYNVGFGGCRMAVHPCPQFDRYSMYRLADAVTTGDFSLQDESFSYEPIGEPLPDYFYGSLQLLKSIDFSKVDIITVAYGTNDFTSENIPLDSEDRYSTGSFAGAMRYSIEKIQKAFPHIKIVVCTQIYRFWRDKDGNFTEDSETSVMGGYKLTDFVAKTKEVAAEYGLFCIDNYTGSGINFETKDICFSDTDSTHPVIAGRKLVAQNIARELAKQYT